MKSISELVIGIQWDIVIQGALHQSFNKSCPNQGKGANIMKTLFSFSMKRFLLFLLLIIVALSFGVKRIHHYPFMDDVIYYYGYPFHVLGLQNNRMLPLDRNTIFNLLINICIYTGIWGSFYVIRKNFIVSVLTVLCFLYLIFVMFLSYFYPWDLRFVRLFWHLTTFGFSFYFLLLLFQVIQLYFPSGIILRRK